MSQTHVFRTFLIGSSILFLVSSAVSCSAAPHMTMIWQDEFNGPVNSSVNTADWLFDIGTCYPGCPAQNWGTGEIESMTNSTDNVYQDGAGHLAIKPLHNGDKWTSGRIETQRTDFTAPSGGILRIEASIQQPNVTGKEASGYWPAFWMLGAPFRGVYSNWPTIGEIDIMEDANGRSSLFGTLHCGISRGGPCNETSGMGSGERPCQDCQTGFHVYAIEYDRSVSPEQIRWYLDDKNYFTVSANQFDEATWNNATKHGCFIILDVAMGGGLASALSGIVGPSTASGVPMLVDYVRIYTSNPAKAAS